MHAQTFASGARTYAAILAALLVLTAITVFAAGIHFGSASVTVVVAMGIATVKAALVALFFMHLRHDKPINAIIFTSSLFFLSLFLVLSLVDVNSRDNVVPIRDIHAPQPAASATPGAQPSAGSPPPASPAP